MELINHIKWYDSFYFYVIKWTKKTLAKENNKNYKHLTEIVQNHLSNVPYDAGKAESYPYKHETLYNSLNKGWALFYCNNPQAMSISNSFRNHNFNPL